MFSLLVQRQRLAPPLGEAFRLLHRSEPDVPRGGGGGLGATPHLPGRCCFDLPAHSARTLESRVIIASPLPIRSSLFYQTIVQKNISFFFSLIFEFGSSSFTDTAPTSGEVSSSPGMLSAPSSSPAEGPPEKTQPSKFTHQSQETLSVPRGGGRRGWAGSRPPPLHWSGF